MKSSNALIGPLTLPALRRPSGGLRQLRASLDVSCHFMYSGALATVVLSALALATNARAEIDKETQHRAIQGFAAEMYGAVSSSLSEAMSEYQLGPEEQDEVTFTATSYVAQCVIEDFVEKPIAHSEDFIQTLANLPDDATILEIMKLQYGNEEAETLWLNIELVSQRCLGRVHELLGLADE